MKLFLITSSALLGIVACVVVGFLLFNRSRGIPIDVVAIEKARDAANENKIRVEVAGGGRVRVNEEEMSVAEMEKRAVDGHWKNGPGVLIVSFDTTPFADAITVFDAVRRAGIEKTEMKTEMQGQK